MKIVSCKNSVENSLKFKDLKIGDCFVNIEAVSQKPIILMKIYPYNKGVNGVVVNCIDLEYNKICCYSDDINVRKINAEIHILPDEVCK